MILTINIENRNTVVGCKMKDGFAFVESLSTNMTATEIEYAIQLKNIFAFHQISLEEIEGAILSSVVPPLTNVMKMALEKLSIERTIVIGPGVKTGLNILTDQPAQVGSDMVAMAVAGMMQYEAPMILVNFGTATTLSVINEKKQYIGGTILPGLSMAADSLSQDTAQLPKVSLEEPKKVIGKNTIDCMKSGLIYGTAASIDGMISRMEKELGKSVKTIVATGGNVKHILPHCERKMCLNETLLLEGLAYIYKKTVG